MSQNMFFCPGCGAKRWMRNEETKFCKLCDTKLTWGYSDGEFTLTAKGSMSKCVAACEPATARKREMDKAEIRASACPPSPGIADTQETPDA